MQQARCDLCGRLVAVEANQPSTCPSCGYALTISASVEPAPEAPPPVVAPAVQAAEPAPTLAQAGSVPGSDAVMETAPALVLGPFVADPAPLIPPAPLPAPPAPEVAAGTPIADAPPPAAPIFVPEAASTVTDPDSEMTLPYPTVAAPPPEVPEEMSAPSLSGPLMPPSDAPILVPLPVGSQHTGTQVHELPSEALADEPVPGMAEPVAMAPDSATEETTSLSGPLMPAAEPLLESIEPPVPLAEPTAEPVGGAPEPEPEPVTQIAEPVAKLMSPELPAPVTPSEPAQSPAPPEPVTQVAEPLAAFVPPAPEPSAAAMAADTALPQQEQPTTAMPAPQTQQPPAAFAPPQAQPGMPPAGYPQYPQYPQYPPYPPPYPSQPGPVGASGYPGYPSYPGYSTDPRTMPSMPPQMIPPGVPYPSAYPGVPVVPPQPPRRKVNPLLIAVIVLVILALVGAGVALALSHGSGNGAPSGQSAATPTIAATATPSVPAGFTVFKDPAGVYSLDVPSDWTQTKTSSGTTSIVVISSTQGVVAEVLTVPTTGLDFQTMANGFFSGVSGDGSVTNKQGPSTVQQAGATWTQESGDTTVASSSEHVVVLLAEHGSGSVLIAFVAPKSDFDSVNTQDFQPMFVSFQFLS